MKKIAILFLLVSLPWTAGAQCQLGFKAGYDYYWFTSPEDGHYSATYDYNHSAPILGLSFRTNSINPLNIGIDLNYSHKVFEVSSSQGGLGGGTFYKYQYNTGSLFMQFQALVKFGKKMKFYFYPGFFGGALIHSSCDGIRSSWQINVPPVNDTISGSASPYYPDAVFGFCAGTGISYPVSQKLSFIFECSYNYTITPVAGEWGSDKVRMIDIYIELGLYYQFELKKKNNISE